jgi:uncharacterized protein with ATP-grasp and redox domains
MEKKYSLELNQRQLRLIAESLEMNNRMICGQLGETFLPPIRNKIYKLIENKDPQWQEKRKIVDNALKTINETLWDGNNYGIGYDDNADLGYEIYKEILHQFEVEHKQICEQKNEEYHHNVHSSKPCLKLTKEPTIIIKEI